MNKTNSQSGEDFARWCKRNGIKVYGGEPPWWFVGPTDVQAFADASAKILEEHKFLWIALAGLPDRFIPAWVWWLVLTVVMVVIVGVLS